MKKKPLLLLMSLLFFMSADARADEWWEEGCCYIGETHFYAKALSGPNFLQSTTANGNNATFETGYIIAGSLGYHWHYGLQLEFEYAFRRNDISKINFLLEGSSENGHFQTSSYMANLLWDVPLALWGCECWQLQPFIGAGVGYDSQQMHSSNSRIIFGQHWHHFSWQLMAGLAYPIFCNTELTLEYKFHQGGCQFYNHTLGVGVAYQF